MKKIFALILAIMMCCTAFVGCTEKADDPKDTGKQSDTTTQSDTSKLQDTEPVVEKVAFEGTVSEVLGRIIEKAKELDTDQQYGISAIECSDLTVDEDSCTDILGLSTEDFNSKVEEAVESKPDKGWFAHSVVVIKVKDGVDTATLADEIIKNTSPSRFGCLKADTIIGGYAGQYIIFAAAAASSAEAVYGAFEALSGIAPTRIDRTNDWSGGGFIG